MATVALTDRQWDVYHGILDQRTPTQMATDHGVGRQAIGHTISELAQLGVIRRRTDLPQWADYRDTYPWLAVDDVTIVYKPLLPPDAKIRALYPVEGERTEYVAPIRHVRTATWSVQGLVIDRIDGKPVKQALPDQRVIVITHRTSGKQTAFTVSIRTPDGSPARLYASLVSDHLRRLKHPARPSHADALDLGVLCAAAAGIDLIDDLTAVVKK